MTRDSDTLDAELSALILQNIDSVPHLETLVLFWDDGTRAWTGAEVARRIYQSLDVARAILRDLQRRGLIVPASGADDAYTITTEVAVRDDIARIVKAYQNKVSQVATLIHSRAPHPVREFARAFDLRGKDKK